MLLAVILFFLAFQSSATLPNGRNVPSVKWKQFETKRFEVVYQEGLSGQAELASRIAEHEFPSICKDLGIHEPELADFPKIKITVCDLDDVANGYADPLGHRIFVWVSGLYPITAGDIPWLRRVVVHELTHQVTYLSQRGVLGIFNELHSMAFMPAWFVEGIAQYHSESWDLNRDFLLRSAYKKGKLRSLKEINGFIDCEYLEGRLIYEQGHSIVRYMVNEFGTDCPAKILKTYKRQWIKNFPAAVRKHTGLRPEELYWKWYEETVAFYEKDMGKRKPVSGRDLKNSIPFSEDGHIDRLIEKNGISFFTAIKHTRTPGRYIYKYNRLLGKTSEIDGPEVSFRFDVSPSGKKLVYSRQRRTLAGRIISAVYIHDISSGKTNRLTSDNFPVSQPVFLSDNTICGILNKGGRAIPVLIKEGAHKPVPVIPDGVSLNKCASPARMDSSNIICEHFDFRGRRYLARISTDGSKYKILTDTSYESRFPSSARNGKIAYTSSVNGIWDLKILDIQSGKSTLISNDNLGLFHPVWNGPGTDSIDISTLQRDGKEAYGTVYRIKVSLPSGNNEDHALEEASNLRPPSFIDLNVWNEYSPLPQDLIPDNYKEENYNSFTSLRPLFALPILPVMSMAFGHGPMNIGGFAYMEDQLAENSVSAGISLNALGAVDYNFGFSNSSFYPNIGISVSSGLFVDSVDNIDSVYNCLKVSNYGVSGSLPVDIIDRTDTDIYINGFYIHSVMDSLDISFDSANALSRSYGGSSHSRTYGSSILLQRHGYDPAPLVNPLKGFYLSAGWSAEDSDSNAAVLSAYSGHGVLHKRVLRKTGISFSGGVTAAGAGTYLNLRNNPYDFILSFSVSPSTEIIDNLELKYPLIPLLSEKTAAGISINQSTGINAGNTDI
ncbi:MAG: peptidase MA family metallohydrolase, partial [Fibrobacterota bacterium]